MTVDPNSALFKAILAMDAYNRSYNQGITLSGNVGGVIPQTDSLVLGFKKDQNGNVSLDENGAPIRNDVDKGFYAIAYKMPDGSVVVSYRGTDQFENGGGTGGDIPNAYGIA